MLNGRTMVFQKKSVYAFSIVEILIALAVLVFGAFGLYEQFLRSHQQGQRYLERIQARCLANQELEQLRATSFTGLKNWRPSPVPQPYPNNLKFCFQDQIVQRPDGLLKLTVRVGWNMTPNERFGPGHSITVEGLKAP